jgi:hypothetical protein
MREFTSEEFEKGHLHGVYFYYSDKDDGNYKRYRVTKFRKDGNITCVEVG